MKIEEISYECFGSKEHNLKEICGSCKLFNRCEIEFFERNISGGNNKKHHSQYVISGQFMKDCLKYKGSSKPKMDIPDWLKS